MTTYNEYSILDIIPDLSQKQILIKTNFKVAAESVNESTVALYNYDKSKLESYQLKVDNKNIHVLLHDYPQDESRYFLQIANIKDALGRTLKTTFNDYIKFESELKNKVTIITPFSRETLKNRIVDISLTVSEDIPLESIIHMEFSTDNIFYNLITTAQCEAKKEINTSVSIEKEGQIYFRARLQQDETYGDWSEFICFNIYTIDMDSIETNFLEDYLTTDDLFDESIIQKELLNVTDRTPIASLDDCFYMEFNKQLRLPSDYDLNEEGYLCLGSIVGYRKELK